MVTLLLFTQCGSTECSVVMQDVDIDGWTDEATLTYTNKQTENNYDLSVVLHVNRRFKAKQLEFEITTMTPDSLRYSEQVTLPVSLSWENPTAVTTDIELPYRRDVTLRCEGEYTMVIAPRQSIVGVEAAGINFQMKR
jgi:hypothetical protein